MASAFPTAGRHQTHAGATEPLLSHLWHEVGDTLHTWHERAVTRRELAEMDEHLLHDIGLTRGDVLREAGKPFWRE